MNAVLIGKTEIDWNKYLILTHKLLSRSVTDSLDAKRMEVRTLAGFVSSLAEFQSENSDPISSQREAGSLLNHVCLTFLISTDAETAYGLAMHGRVKLVDCEVPGFLIASGTLADWRETVINFCNSRSTTQERSLLSNILNIMDGLQLGPVFENYSRATDRKGGILLTEK
jgi:hypothetical protein